MILHGLESQSLVNLVGGESVSARRSGRSLVFSGADKHTTVGLGDGSVGKVTAIET